MTELRGEIEGFLKSLAADLAIDAAITIGLALISFGAGAVTAGKALITVQKWAGKIKDGIIAWRARKALQIAGVQQEAKDAAVKARKVVTDLRDRLRGKIDDVGKAPKVGPKNSDEVRDVLDSRTAPGRNKPNRQLDSDAEIRQLYEDLTRGADTLDVGSYPGRRARLEDGTEIKIRDKSESGGVTIDILYPGSRRPVKVHLP